MCVVIWQIKGNEYQRYLGYIITKIIDGKLLVDHLVGKLKDSDSKWKYTSKADV